MKVHIVGGSGFIGTYLQRRLYSKIDFTNIDIKLSNVYKEQHRYADVRDEKELLKVIDKADCLVLLSAEHKDNVKPISLYYDVNVNGAKNIVNVAIERGIRKIIFLSSVAVYGFNNYLTNENHLPFPNNHYGTSKFQAEKILEDWYNNDTQNRSLIIIRPTVVFGPGNRGNVHNLLKQIFSKKFIMIGSGENKKSMAYVENLVEFIHYCIVENKKMNGKNIINFVDKPDLTLNELVKISSGIMGKSIFPFKIPYLIGLLIGYFFDLLSFIMKKKFEISSVRVKKFCTSTQYDSNILSTFDFRPPFSLFEGLSKTIISISNEENI